jgi:hypothetical protein
MKVAPSRSQKEAAVLLEQLGCEVRLETLTSLRIYPGKEKKCPGYGLAMVTDILVVSWSASGMSVPLWYPIAVEFDGPSHFLTHPNTRLNGATLLRRRMLSRWVLEVCRHVIAGTYRAAALRANAVRCLCIGIALVVHAANVVMLPLWLGDIPAG